MEWVVAPISDLCPRRTLVPSSLVGRHDVRGMGCVLWMGSAGQDAKSHPPIFALLHPAKRKEQAPQPRIAPHRTAPIVGQTGPKVQTNAMWTGCFVWSCWPLCSPLMPTHSPRRGQTRAWVTGSPDPLLAPTPLCSGRHGDSHSIPLGGLCQFPVPAPGSSQSQASAHNTRSRRPLCCSRRVPQSRREYVLNVSLLGSRRTLQDKQHATMHYT